MFVMVMVLDSIFLCFDYRTSPSGLNLQRGMGKEENDNNESESLEETPQSENELGNLDKILSQIGMGRWQITIFIINFLSKFKL